jgi:hypothetical protein
MRRERGKLWSAWPIHGEARGENRKSKASVPPSGRE